MNIWLDAGGLREIRGGSCLWCCEREGKGEGKALGIHAERERIIKGREGTGQSSMFFSDIELKPDRGK